MGRKYKNPPVIEAICEFRFQPGKVWDLSFYGRISGQLGSTFPTSRSEKAIGIAREEHPELGPVNKIIQSESIRLLNKAQTAHLLIEPNRLAVTHAVPYPTWEKYLPLIQTSFTAYRKITEPKGFQRIGLRYRNKIDFQEGRVDLADFFTFHATDLEGLAEFVEFSVRKAYPYSNGRDYLGVELSSSTPSKEQHLSVSLDLDYFLGRPGAVSIGNWKRWLNTAHNRLERGFESCITPALRERFQEVK